MYYWSINSNGQFTEIRFGSFDFWNHEIKVLHNINFRLSTIDRAMERLKLNVQASIKDNESAPAGFY